ncbi:hypothetical protein [Streptomyces narbonensis]|uniref:hypothetical protein n=1 Tax=Streptomyces narbonensis TaxID=67333 RepID=UPI001671F9DC|nr:hypothetical protein [Streptomyces narbonensis]
MTTTGRVVAWAAGVVALGLIGVAVFVDLDSGDRIASVVGAVVGLVVAAYTFVGPSGSSGRRIRAGRGATVIDGDVSGSAVGRGAKVVGPPTAPRTGPPRARGADDDVRAAPGGKVVLGDVTDSALGDESERR